MALINCPECAGQVSDRAPVCPHCGFPLDASNADSATAPAVASTVAPPATAVAAVAESATPETSAVPFEPWEPPFRLRIAGRPVPIAMVLFWGGMTLGMILNFAMPETESNEFVRRTVPMGMVWLGVLWFAVTEFYTLMRNRARRRRA